MIEIGTGTTIRWVVMKRSYSSKRRTILFTYLNKFALTLNPWFI